MQVLVSGSLAYDRIMDFPGRFSDHILPNKIHTLNVSFGIEKMTTQFGGTAGNIAFNLSLQKIPAAIISQVGNDFSDYRKWLLKNTVDLSLVRKIKTTTCATAHVITDKADNQITGFHFGAMKYSALADKTTKQKIIKQLNKPELMGILAPGNTDDMMQLAKLYQANNVSYIFDPGQQTTWLSGQQLKQLLKGAAILIVNDYELALILKKTNQTKTQLIRKIKKLIVTLGEAGAIWYSEVKKTKLPIARPKKVIDPTGAGDAYRAGVIQGIINEWDDALSGRVAALCATYAIENYGTQQHKYSINQFKNRFKKTFNRKLDL